MLLALGGQCGGKRGVLPRTCYRTCAEKEESPGMQATLQIPGGKRNWSYSFLILSLIFILIILFSSFSSSSSSSSSLSSSSLLLPHLPHSTPFPSAYILVYEVFKILVTLSVTKTIVTNVIITGYFTP